MSKVNEKLRNITVQALFCAMSFAAVFVLRISGIGGFLTFDIKDVIIATSALLFGPMSGVMISLIVSILEMITVSGTGFWGAVMNFVSSTVFSAVAGLVYNSFPVIKKKFSGALCGMGFAIISATASMLALNILITPIYTGMPVSGVVSLIPKLLLPFNLIKFVMNAALVMIIYKPVSLLISRFNIKTAISDEKYLSKRTIAVIVIGLAVVTACAIILIVKFGGSFEPI